MESEKENVDLNPQTKYNRSMIRDEFPREFVDNFLSLVFNNINELINDTDDISKVEEKLLLLIKVLKNGLER